MANLIACRLASYGRFQERAWTHLPQIGITHVEMPVPSPNDRASVKERLAASGLRAVSLQAMCDVARPDAVEVMRPQLEACAELGARICFLSAKTGGTDRRAVLDRLRAIGEAAQPLGVTVALETHPDLVTNGDVGRRTMDAIGHPAVRINFDTGNISFYNEGRSAVGELAKVIGDVVSVHLKDTTGGYQEWNFPALGRGVVDFPEVFRMLGARGFTGPFTMELEGTRGVDLDEAAQLACVADSVAYLRAIGAWSG